MILFRRLPRRSLALCVVTGCVLPLAGPATAARRDATLTVRAGGDRLSAERVGGLKGVRYDFYSGVAGRHPDVSERPDAFCVTRSGGTCAVGVPARSGAGQGYWVVAHSAPLGWTVPERLDTSPRSGPWARRPYDRLFTGPVRKGQRATFPMATAGPARAAAQWANVRDNPPAPERCGAKVAMVMDLSSPVRPHLGKLREAAAGFVRALTGTPSQVAVFTFAARSPAPGLKNAALPLTSVADPRSAATVRAKVRGVTATKSRATSWDSALWQVARDPADFDMVLMLTGDGPGGSVTQLRDIENGIFAANAVKAQDTRVVPVRLGSGRPTGNLKAISGPVRNEDHFVTGFDRAKALLGRLAGQQCAGTVNVVQYEIPRGRGHDDAVPRQGWRFTTPTPNVRPSSAETDETGALSFGVGFSGTEPRKVTIRRTPEPGFKIVRRHGGNATCTVNGRPVDADNVGDHGFRVDAFRLRTVTCAVYYRAPRPVTEVHVG